MSYNIKDITRIKETTQSTIICTNDITNQLPTILRLQFSQN